MLTELINPSETGGWVGGGGLRRGAGGAVVYAARDDAASGFPSCVHADLLSRDDAHAG